jgi:hypothetical protein
MLTRNRRVFVDAMKNHSTLTLPARCAGPLPLPQAGEGF